MNTIGPRVSILLLSASLFFGGCFAEFGDSDVDVTPRARAAAAENDANIESISLSGELAGFDAVGAQTVDFVYQGDGYLSFDLYSTARRNVVMNGVQVDNLEAFELGREYRFTNSYYGTGDEPFVSVLGCAGPARYEWDVDRSADDVTVVVNELDDGSLEVVYEAEFGNQGRTGGSFVVAN